MDTHRPIPWRRLLVAAAVAAGLLGLVCLAYSRYYTGHFTEENLPVPDYIEWAAWLGAALSLLAGLYVLAESIRHWRALPAD